MSLIFGQRHQGIFDGFYGHTHRIDAIRTCCKVSVVLESGWVGVAGVGQSSCRFGVNRRSQIGKIFYLVEEIEVSRF